MQLWLTVEQLEMLATEIQTNGRASRMSAVTLEPE